MIHHRLKTYFSLRHYISFLRRQSTHMKHVYAVVFAGSITLLLAVAILYFDYGLWHDPKEVTTQEVTRVDISSDITSPEDMVTNFFYQVKDKWQSLKEGGKTLLEGKETYSRDTNQDSN